LLIRLEYVSAYTPIPLAIHFLAAETRSKFPVFILIPCALFVAVIPFAPLPVLTRSILAYYPLIVYSIVFIFAALIIPAVRRKEENSRTLLAGSIVVAVAGVNDMLFASFVVGTGNLLPAALVVFIVIMSFVLASRYTRTFSQTERLLAEKETFLKEMHHRVKNSLQIVSSVVTMQFHRVSNPDSASQFSAMSERIRAIALVHEKLYAAPADGDVDLAEYVRDLVLQSARSNGPVGADIPSLEIGAEVGPSSIEFCVDFGLVLTELLLNAYKHGGGPRRVELRRAGDLVSVVVRDSGPGFKSGIMPGTGNTLGFKIVSSVVRRRGGSLETVTENGAVVTATMRTDAPSAGSKA